MEGQPRPLRREAAQGHATHGRGAHGGDVGAVHEAERRARGGIVEDDEEVMVVFPPAKEKTGFRAAAYKRKKGSPGLGREHWR